MRGNKKREVSKMAEIKFAKFEGSLWLEVNGFPFAEIYRAERGRWVVVYVVDVVEGEFETAVQNCKSLREAKEFALNWWREKWSGDFRCN